MNRLTMLLMFVFCAKAFADSATFEAQDTLDIAADGDPAIQTVLDGLAWAPARFDVICIATPRRDYDALVTFPSPRPSGDEALDRAHLLWYAVRDEDGRAVEAPAAIVVHSLQPDQVFARAMARGLMRRGVHAFVLQMPGYGERQVADGRHPGVTALLHGEQAVADVRRARDTVAVLPNVRAGPVALVGISLGGFVAPVAASLDGTFDPVFLVLAGADTPRVLASGWLDARRVHHMLAAEGFTGDKLRALVIPVEPGVVAHRLDPKRTWLFSAENDRVVPAFSSDLLAQRIGLDDGHHVRFSGNHYTAVFAMPGIVRTIADVILHE